MGLIKWVVAAGLGVAGYYGYCKLRAIEGELRKGVAGAEESSLPKGGYAEAEVTPETGVGESIPAEVKKMFDERLLTTIRQHPGMLQTELYELYPRGNRRTIQEILRKLDQQGRLDRSREKGTYRLHPVR